jgi:hypothetical protein
MKLIDYALGATSISNPDGTMPVNAINCTVVPGPGITTAGNFPNALDFGVNGRIQVALTPAQVNTKKYCIRTVFKVDAPVTARQNLVESTCLPFSIFIDKAGAANKFKVVVSVAPKLYGWSGTSTEFFKDLQLGTWITADLVYDHDTVAVFINGTIISVHAYPNGTTEKGTGNQLFIGTWINGANNHFNGKMALVQWYNDEIPADLGAQLDERRSHAEWFLTYKQESIKSTINLGFPTGKYTYDTSAGAYVQMMDAGLLMYNESMGIAFEMHGAIFQYYKTYASKNLLGYLITDEANTTKAGGKKSLFSKGGIYWSGQTGAIAVHGKIYLEYENLDESRFFGWPVAAAATITNGQEQLFQNGRMYYKTGTAKAFEVHGLILAKFLSSGGIATWGYPTSNESDLRSGAAVVGKFNDFEGCTIYWSAGTGAFEVHGDIRVRYKALNGPAGQLGFPTSDEANIPGASGAARYNTFQNGSILWFGNASSIYVCMAFKLFLGRINSKESEGAFMGQNDLYLRTVIEDNGHEIFRQRFPNSGDFSGKNVVDINANLSQVIVPNSPSRIIKFTVDVWESDSGAPFGGGDDHLGIYSKVLNMANAWGMRENNGIFNSGSFSMINSITWSVKPQVNPALLTDAEKWWAVKNQGTATITKAQYAAAFKDVDSAPEWWDVSDWLEKAFYELVAKGIAGGGNCFGMSLEAIYAYKQRSLFGLPINRFTSWNTVVNEFNIKHQYQVGAQAIWWMVGQFLSGNTHDPVDVFNRTRAEHAVGCDPVVCISQNYDFSGAPHCILPIRWNSSVTPWQMSVLDPNFPGQVKTLYVDPNRNEFIYEGGSKYQGDAWSGGRFHYMPYSVLNGRPRTPVWDAILLLLAGTIVILGSDTETMSLVDEQGNDLDAFGADSIKRLKAGQALTNKFVAVKGFHAKGKGAIASEMYLRTEKQNNLFTAVRPGLFDYTSAGNLSLGDVIGDRNIAAGVQTLMSDTQLFGSVKDRSLMSIINDKKLMAKLTPAAATALGSLVKTSAIDKNFSHKVRGVKNGLLTYAIKNKLNELMLETGIKTNEMTTITTEDMGSASSVVKMTCNENKTVKLEISNKLGIGGDNLKIVIDKIPAAAGKELSLNIKPGLAGLDILTTAEKINAQVSVNGKIDGKPYNSVFGVDIEGGIRIRPSSILTSNELKTGKIDQLFGQVRDVKMIQKK